MTALETTRSRDRSLDTDRSSRWIDSAPVLGTWLNFDTDTTGITRLVVTNTDEQLVLRITEAGNTNSAEWETQRATVLADGVDLHLAIGFLASAELGAEFGSRSVTLCSYLNRGLLTIDAHTAFIDAHTAFRGSEPRANFMARAHFYRSDTDAPQ